MQLADVLENMLPPFTRSQGVTLDGLLAPATDGNVRHLTQQFLN